MDKCPAAARRVAIKTRGHYYAKLRVAPRSAHDEDIEALLEPRVNHRRASLILNTRHDAIVAIFPAINPPAVSPSYKFPRLRSPGYFSRLMYARISVTESLFTRGKIIISLGKVGAEFTTL